MEFAPGAWRYAALAAVLATAAAIAVPFGLAAFVLPVFVLWFHRDPERVPPENGVLAPADGRVSVIREEGGRVRVGVFMNVTDVHVNRAPLGGTVDSVTHTPGAHRPAFSKDSDRNERVEIDCGSFSVTLVAGAFARRIHPYVDAGDSVERGDRLGHISFGSRADVLLPAAYDVDDVLVERGDAVRAGETVFAPSPPDREDPTGE